VSVTAPAFSAKLRAIVSRIEVAVLGAADEKGGPAPYRSPMAVAAAISDADMASVLAELAGSARDFGNDKGGKVTLHQFNECAKQHKRARSKRTEALRKEATTRGRAATATAAAAAGGSSQQDASSWTPRKSGSPRPEGSPGRAAGREPRAPASPTQHLPAGIHRPSPTRGGLLPLRTEENPADVIKRLGGRQWSGKEAAFVSPSRRRGFE